MNSASATACPSTTAVPFSFQIGALPLRHLDVQLEPVARDDGPAEPRAVDPHEVGDLVLGLLGPERHHREERAACASASRMRTPGMTGFPGKCPGKNGSFIVTLFQATSRFARLDRDDPVDEQERRAVGQEPLDRLDVEDRASAALRSFGGHPSSPSRPAGASTSLRGARGARGASR